MQQTLRGIVLRTVKYGDTSIIVDLFTESHGRMSFMASTSRAKRSVRNVSFWQPLSMVEFSAELLPNGGKLPRPSDVRTYYNYMDLPFSPVKSTLALFLSEFLSAALREEKENAPLFRYIESSLQWLDLAEAPASVANFHLAFLMHLSRFIGIYPNLDLNPNSSLPLGGVGGSSNPQLYFDLLAGSYCERQPLHAHFLAFPYGLCDLASFPSVASGTDAHSSSAQRVLPPACAQFPRIEILGSIARIL